MLRSEENSSSNRRKYLLKCKMNSSHVIFSFKTQDIAVFSVMTGLITFGNNTFTIHKKYPRCFSDQSYPRFFIFIEGTGVYGSSFYI